MDRHFLEFWGNYLLLLAKGQKQLEDLAQWSQQGFGNFADLTDLFRKAYGLDEQTQDSPDYLKLWQQAQEDFRQSLRDYLGLMGMVPREEYLELAGKYEGLKEKVADQEETIKQLRLLLADKGLDFNTVTSEFQELMQKQGDQFQKMLQGLGEIFAQASKKPN
jgi:hypothetical protein